MKRLLLLGSLVAGLALASTANAGAQASPCTAASLRSLVALSAEESRERGAIQLYSLERCGKRIGVLFG